MQINAYKKEQHLGNYLAGLWEGDGHVEIRKDQNDRPSFHISFNIKDSTLAFRLLKVIEAKPKKGSIGTQRKPQLLYSTSIFN